MVQSGKRKRVLIVGASDTGQALARSIYTTFEVVLLDVRPERLEAASARRLPEAQLTVHALDGTSLLNLRQAGLDDAEWLIAVTERDEANVEIARIGLSVERPPAVVAVVGSVEAQETLKALGAEVLLRPTAIAGLIGNVINRGLRVAVNVGLGRGEVVEIPILPSSPTVDVRVADLRARRWLVAAIYRGNEIIVPHGDAIIRAGDRLLLSGEPDILPDIAEYLRAGVARFPLQYGRRLVVCPPARTPGPADDPGDGFFRELAFVAEKTHTSAITVLSAEGGREAPLPELPGLPAVTRQSYRPPLALHLGRERHNLDCGCLVLPKRRGGLLARIGMTRPWYAPLVETLPAPTLLAAGRAPYGRIVLAVTGAMDVTVAAELAVDVARRFALPLHAVTVSPPDFVSGSESVAAHGQALKEVSEVAAQYRVSVQETHLNGNPVRELAAFLGPSDLLVVSHRPGRRPSVLSPDAGMLLIEHAPCSTLVLCGRPAGRGRP